MNCSYKNTRLFLYEILEQLGEHMAARWYPFPVEIEKGSSCSRKLRTDPLPYGDAIGGRELDGVRLLLRALEAVPGVEAAIMWQASGIFQAKWPLLTTNSRLSWLRRTYWGGNEQKGPSSDRHSGEGPSCCICVSKLS